MRVRQQVHRRNPDVADNQRYRTGLNTSVMITNTYEVAKMENQFNKMFDYCRAMDWNGWMKNVDSADPEKIVKIRLAKGEITPEEYDALM